MSILPTLPAPPAGRHLRAVPDLDRVVLRFVGELDVARVEEIRAQVGEALDSGHRTIALDLAGVTFMDCASLGALIACQRRARRRGVRLRIDTASTAVRRVLELTHTGAALGPPPVA